MKKLKCETCGANLQIDEKKEFGYCEYCQTKYKLNDEVKVNVKIDKPELVMPELPRSFIIMRAFVFVFIAIVAFIIFYQSFSMFSSIKENHIEYTNPTETRNHKREYYNSVLELYAGSQTEFFTNAILEEVITNNKTSEYKTEVIYGDIKTTNPDEITVIKKKIEKGTYEVSLDYDKDSYVKSVTITKDAE